MKEEFYKSILENLELSLAVFDAEGKFVFANNKFSQNYPILLNLSANEIKSKLGEKFSSQIYDEYEIIILNENQTHSDFISTVSHELRTPLTSIRGFADTMLMSADKLTEEQRNKFLTIIRNQADRLTRLVENLLEVSNLSRKNKMILKEIGLSSFLNPLLNIFERKYINQKFILNIPANLPNVWADSDMLEQIMTNLLDNAGKYSKENSLIEIKAKFHNDKVILQIIDNADKIPENQFENIFKKFSRIDNPLTRKVEGSGLGLFITKALIEKMNGKIFVEHHPNGNIFTLSLPVYSAEKHLENKISGGNS